MGRNLQNAISSATSVEYIRHCFQFFCYHIAQYQGRTHVVFWNVLVVLLLS